MKDSSENYESGSKNPASNPYSRKTSSKKFHSKYTAKMDESAASLGSSASGQQKYKWLFKAP